MDDSNLHNIIRTVADNICALALSDKYLLIARDSGKVMKYTFPEVTFEGTFVLRTRTPQKISLNMTSTRLGVIDPNAMLHFVDVATGLPISNKGVASIELIDYSRFYQVPATGTPANDVFERKDAWDIMWARDNAELWAMMEKTRMYIFRGIEPEEPITTNCCINILNNSL
jgi:WD repeat-containing protein 35